MQRKIVLNINPETHVRATQGDRVFFRIPRDQLKPGGLKRLQRLEKYNRYKISLLAEAKRNRFVLPEQGAQIIFYIPVSKSWKKWKKEKMHMQLHQEKPDIDNLYKALGDSLLVEDKHIASVTITKKWVNQEKGWIEIIVSDPIHGSSDNLI